MRGRLFLLRGLERHGKLQTLLDHIGTVHRPVQPAVRFCKLAGCIVVDYSENGRIKATLIRRLCRVCCAGSISWDYR